MLNLAYAYPVFVFVLFVVVVVVFVVPVVVVTVNIIVAFDILWHTVYVLGQSFNKKFPLLRIYQVK